MTRISDETMEYLRRHTNPTPFERALMTGSTMHEAREIALRDGGGFAIRPWHRADEAIAEEEAELRDAERRAQESA